VAVKVLLDSVVLIDHFNGVRAATSYLKEIQGEAWVSVITRAEVLCGFDAAAAELALRLLERFPTLPIDRDAADLAASLRRTHRWRLPDAFQAALAQLHGLKLATRNVRDFPPDQFDFVVAPYRL
jgi:predicted nucleic acid-binding protein